MLAKNLRASEGSGYGAGAVGASAFKFPPTLSKGYINIKSGGNEVLVLYDDDSYGTYGMVWWYHTMVVVYLVP